MQTVTLSAEPVAVRNTKGLVHGFLVLSTLEGKVIAAGDLTQVAHGDRVTNHRQLLRDHLVQKGPTFDHPVYVAIDCAGGQTTVRYIEDGKERMASTLIHGFGEWDDSHAVEEYSPGCRGDQIVDSGGNTETKTGKAGDFFTGRVQRLKPRTSW
jgi:hypothetical protein